MCIRSVHDVTYSVIDMEESIKRAAEKADRLESYLNGNIDSFSESRILYELNAVDSELRAARSKNAFIRKAHEKGHRNGGLRHGP